MWTLSSLNKAYRDRDIKIREREEIQREEITIKIVKAGMIPKEDLTTGHIIQIGREVSQDQNHETTILIETEVIQRTRDKGHGIGVNHKVGEREVAQKEEDHDPENVQDVHVRDVKK